MTLEAVVAATAATTAVRTTAGMIPLAAAAWDTAGATGTPAAAAAEAPSSGQTWDTEEEIQDSTTEKAFLSGKNVSSCFVAQNSRFEC